MPRFADRRDAGRRLVARLTGLVSEHTLVLALPRGGVPVAFEIARAFNVQLDVWVVRKIGAPWNPELGLGAVAEQGFSFVNHELLSGLGLSETQLTPYREATSREVEARVEDLRQGGAPPALLDRDVLVVDDGLATGGTLLAALRSIEHQRPRSITVALPVAAAQALPLITAVAPVVCLNVATDLRAVGFWYEDFSPVADADVRHFLREVKANPNPEIQFE